MKKLFNLLLTVFLLACLAALLLPTVARAQSPGVATVSPWNGGTNNVPASGVSSTNTGGTFAVSEFDNLGLQFSFKGDAAGTSNVLFTAYRSLDSTSYETAPFFSQLYALNGTTTVTYITNLSIPSAGTIKVIVINTNAAGNVTNLSVQRRLNAPKKTNK